MVMAMRVPGSKRSEDCLPGMEMTVLALANLPHGGVIHHADRFRGDLDREMEVPEQPAEPRRLLRRVAERHFQHRLRLLFDRVNGRTALMEDVAILERMLQIEPEVHSILG